ncbi:hypothetical protein Tco_0289750, partial [Tanacetum coccineum]
MRLAVSNEIDGVCFCDVVTGDGIRFFCWVRIHQGGKSLSSLAANVKNFDGKLLGKVRKPMKARCCVFFEEPGANQANPDGITIMIMKDNCDVMNATNTGLGDNSIPKAFYTSNWVHNEPLKAANENPNAPHVDSGMGRFMDVNHVGLNANVANVVDRTTRSGCIKSGVDTDKPVKNVTTNPKVVPNKLLNKEGVQIDSIYLHISCTGQQGEALRKVTRKSFRELIHQGGKSLSTLATNVKNFDGKLLGKVRKPMKARCCVFFEEPGANQANPYGITIMIMKDNFDVMNAANTGLGDNSIPKVFYTSNWVHNEPLKAANENPNAPHVDSGMGRFMDVNHVGLNANVANVMDRTTRSGCIKSGVDTDKPVHNVTTNPKVAPNKLLNKEGVQKDRLYKVVVYMINEHISTSLTVDFLWFLKGMGKKTMELEQKWWITVLPLRQLSSCDLVFTVGVNKKVAVDGCCKGVNTRYDDTGMGHSKSVKAKDGSCTNIAGVTVEMEQPGSSASYSRSILTGMVDKSPDSTYADIFIGV